MSCFKPNAIVSTCVLMWLLSHISSAQTSFTDVAPELGIDYHGTTFGSSWADINGDGLLDMYMSCHFNISLGLYDGAVPHVFIQKPSGTFETFTLSMLPQSDIHGAGFFDFDRDGDKDFLNCVGGSNINVFYENNGGWNLTNEAGAYGLAYLGGRGRTPTFVDVNRDGYLDVILNNEANASGLAPTTLLLNQNGQQFMDVSEITNFPQNAAIVSILGNFSSVLNLDFLMVGKYPGLYTASSGGFQQMVDFNIDNLTDATIGDFDGDMKQDIFFCKAISTSETKLKNDTACQGMYQLKPTYPNHVKIKFKSNSNLHCTLTPRHHDQYFNIYRGSHVPFSTRKDTTLVLDIEDPLLTDTIFNGAADSLLASWKIWREGENWVFKGTASTIQKWTTAIEVLSDSTVTELQTIGLPAQNLSTSRDYLYLNEGSYSFTLDGYNSVGLPVNAHSAVAADFDNDMDLDIYVVTSGAAGNTANYLLENDGTGQFSVADSAWGAVGTTEGVGDAASLNDFNNDGFMDLFVTNGLSVFFLDNAPVQLFKNQGNDNHWIKLNLMGVQSNPSGIGASVLCFAGEKAQIRFQDGGMHSRCQNDERINFGLGSNTMVDSMHIIWPSGTHQVLYNLTADQILDVVEPPAPGLQINTPTFDVWVYPQPSTGTVFVETPDVAITNATLYNALGQLVHTSATRIFDHRIELSLDPGVYFIQLTDESGISVKRKIVVR